VKGCAIDDDCPDGDRPACSITSGECVECIYSDHCDGETPICSSFRECVECESDTHCKAGESCEDYMCTANPTSSATELAVGFVLLACTFLSRAL
jgi:Cys-rich repeat protein